MKMVDYKQIWPETVLIWGAGATRSLGLEGTEGLGKIISRLTGIGDHVSMDSSLDERIDYAFEDYPISSDLKVELKDLLLLLSDANEPMGGTKLSRQAHLQRLIHRHGKGLDKAAKSELGSYLENLYRYYDWLGLRSIARYISRRWDGYRKETELVDLLTTVDLLYDMELAIQTEGLLGSGRPDENFWMIGKERLLGVRRCLVHLMSTIQRILVQETPGAISESLLGPYIDIAQNLTELMREESEVFLARDYEIDSRDFYLCSTAIVSFNWDPVLLWLLFRADQERSDSRIVLGDDEYLLRLYHDLGDGIGVRKFSEDEDRQSVFALMMNEQACRTFNERDRDLKRSKVMRISKILFPHAGFGWRICPRCGKLFIDFGDLGARVTSPLAFGPDLLPGLQKDWKPRTRAEKLLGRFGVIQCIFCEALTYPYDCPLIMQSTMKYRRHHVLHGIFNELGLIVGNARHLVFAGYSLPKDDFLYKCFFQTAWAGKKPSDREKYCSLVLLDPEYRAQAGRGPWFERNELIQYLKKDCTRDEQVGVKQTIRNMLQIFDLDSIRVSVYGMPDIITSHPRLSSKEALKDLLYPLEVYGNFPPRRGQF